jgi:hypothetical protein
MFLGFLLGIAIGLTPIYWEKKGFDFGQKPIDIFIYGFLISAGLKLFYIWLYQHEGWAGWATTWIGIGCTRIILVSLRFLNQKKINKNVYQVYLKNRKKILICIFGLLVLILCIPKQWLDGTLSLETFSILFFFSGILAASGLSFLYKWLITAITSYLWMGITFAMIGLANILIIWFFSNPILNVISKQISTISPFLIGLIVITGLFYVLGKFWAGMYLVGNYVKEKKLKIALPVSVIWAGFSLILTIAGTVFLIKYRGTKDFFLLFSGITLLPFGMGNFLVSISMFLMGIADRSLKNDH